MSLTETSALSAERAWLTARWITRWKPIVCCSTYSLPSGILSILSWKKVSMLPMMFSTFPPQFSMTSIPVWSYRMANRMCSTLTYSCRRFLASLTANPRVAESSLLIMVYSLSMVHLRGKPLSRARLSTWSTLVSAISIG